MKHILPVFSLFLAILLMSCNSEVTSSCQELATENRMLKDSLAKNQQFSTMKSEAIVELGNMNIVYRGVDNPIKIAVPNAIKFSVMAPGLKIGENGDFVLRPTTGEEVTFQIVANMRNGEQLRFEKVFRIEDVGSKK